MRVVLLGGVLAPLLPASLAGRSDETRPQRAIIEAVHSLFPDPVPYVDRNGMIASFPKAGFFMSSWGMEAYHQHGQPVFAALLQAQRPPLLIANAIALRAALDTTSNGFAGAARLLLLPADAKVLQDNFVHHWGPIYVAGKQLALTARQPVRFSLYVGGPYTIEGHRPLLIDGIERKPGEVVTLRAGEHVALSLDGGSAVTLRWGSHLALPAEPPPTDPIYVGFTGVR